MAEAKVHGANPHGTGAGDAVCGAPITFFDDVCWLFTDPVERLFFYRQVDPAAAFPPHALTRFLPLAGILSPAARCFSYSSGHDALDLVLAVLMEDFNWLEYEITPHLLNQDGSSLSIH